VETNTFWWKLILVAGDYFGGNYFFGRSYFSVEKFEVRIAKKDKLAI
jgi:hypothetical protein